MFDIEVYKRMLEKYRLKVEEKYGEYCGFAYDGPIVPERWNNKKINNVKILFYAKETYGHDGCSICPIMESPDGYSASKTNLNISKLSYCINQLFSKIRRSKCKSLTAQDLFKLIDEVVDGLPIISKCSLREYYSNVAVVEVKKTSGDVKSNDVEIRKHSVENAGFLTEQIKYLSPDIIICCGLVTWHSLVNDTGLINDKTSITNERGGISYGNMILYNSFHPSAPRFNMYDVLFNIFECIIDKSASNAEFAKAWQ
ncbi:hypothetical protein HRH25_12730 [Flavisolibacter sp. BT320]|nr:hypothetical protein [Flavisolibacter longurius]